MTWPVPVWKAGGWTVAAILGWLVWYGYRQHRRTSHDSQPEPRRSGHDHRTHPPHPHRRRWLIG
jgi:hypothetical protein